MKYLKKIAVKFRWIGMLGASLWWAGVYVDYVWMFLKHMA